MPASGDPAIWEEAAPDDRVRLAVRLPAGSRGTFNHRHPNQIERLEVLSGRLLVSLGRQTHRLRTGDVIVIPAGMPHWVRNDGSEEVCAVCELEPALGGRGMLEALFGLRRRTSNTLEKLSFLQLAVLLYEFRHEIRLAGPLVPHPLIDFVGATAKLLGLGGV
ncbi:MAG: cupin domain-containing protein [Acidobacteriota bacterium]